MKLGMSLHRLCSNETIQCSNKIVFLENFLNGTISFFRNNYLIIWTFEVSKLENFCYLVLIPIGMTAEITYPIGCDCGNLQN